jgi:hypothetical protein
MDVRSIQKLLKKQYPARPGRPANNADCEWGRDCHSAELFCRYWLRDLSSRCSHGSGRQRHCSLLRRSPTRSTGGLRPDYVPAGGNGDGDSDSTDRSDRSSADAAKSGTQRNIALSSRAKLSVAPQSPAAHRYLFVREHDRSPVEPCTAMPATGVFESPLDIVLEL